MEQRIKDTRRNIQARTSYKRYKKFYENILTEKDPELILIAAHQLVTQFGGHKSMHNNWVAKQSVNLLIDNKNIEKAKENNELPLLVGHKFLHSTSLPYLEGVLKGEK